MLDNDLSNQAFSLLVTTVSHWRWPTIMLADDNPLSLKITHCVMIPTGDDFHQIKMIHDPYSSVHYNPLTSIIFINLGVVA